MKQRRFGRAERKAQILAALSRLDDRGEPVKMTQYQIARVIEMTPSWHLMEMLSELVEAGEITCNVEVHRANHWKRVYQVAEMRQVMQPSLFKQARHIMVNGVRMEVQQ